MGFFSSEGKIERKEKKVLTNQQDDEVSFDNENNMVFY